MEPEDSLPCSDEFATGTYPEADESSPCSQTLRFNNTHLSEPRSPKWSFLFRVPGQNIVYIFRLPCYMPRPSRLP